MAKSRLAASRNQNKSPAPPITVNLHRYGAS